MLLLVGSSQDFLCRLWLPIVSDWAKYDRIVATNGTFVYNQTIKAPARWKLELLQTVETFNLDKSSGFKGK